MPERIEKEKPLCENETSINSISLCAGVSMLSVLLKEELFAFRRQLKKENKVYTFYLGLLIVFSTILNVVLFILMYSVFIDI